MRVYVCVCRWVITAIQQDSPVNSFRQLHVITAIN